MQTAVQSGNGHQGAGRVQVPDGALKILLALASPKAAESESLRRKLRFSDEESKSIVDGLQESYMVDVVSYLDGTRISEVLRITEFGESALTSAMERTCELPE